MIRVSILAMLAVASLGQLTLGNPLNKGRPCIYNYNYSTPVQSDNYCTLKITFYTKINLKGEKLVYHLPPYYHVPVQNNHELSCVNLPPRFAGRVRSLKVEDPDVAALGHNRVIYIFDTKDCSTRFRSYFAQFFKHKCWMDWNGTVDGHGIGPNCTAAVAPSLFNPTHIEAFNVQYNYYAINPTPTEASG